MKVVKMGNIYGREKGHVLLMALVIMTVGATIIGALFLYLNTSLLASSKSQERALTYYAADSGIEYALFQLQNGSEDMPPPYDINNNTVNVTITEVAQQDPSYNVYRITSTASGDSGGSTTIESYVSLASADFGWLLESVITSNGNVTIQPGAEVTGNITYTGTLKNDGTIDGNVTELLEDIRNWPTCEEFATFYWEDVKDLVPFADGTIDVADTPSIGPLYREGSLAIKSTVSQANATLNGTIYGNVTGAITKIGTTNKDFTLNLNGQTIFVKGALTIGGKTTIAGSGCIIACGDIFFEPNMATNPGDFVFIMSINGTTKLQPGGDFYGALAGNVDVTIQPKCTLEWGGAGGEDGLTMPTAGEREQEILAYKIK